jgi:hypothetical protein
MAAKETRKLQAAALVASATTLVVGCGGNGRHRQGVSSNTGTAHAWTELTWKCEDRDSQGRPIGPAILSNRAAAQDYDAKWHTRAEARAIARRLRLHYTEDC